jgi:hypothetical protein
MSVPVGPTVPIQDCRLDALQLQAQLERYRRLGRHATSIQRQHGEVLVRFADDLPGGLLEQTLEVERRCCPFIHVAYDPRERRLIMTVENLEQHPKLDSLLDALQPNEMQHHPQPETECCSPVALASCCQPESKDACCGTAVVGPPSGCGCQA